MSSSSERAREATAWRFGLLPAALVLLWLSLSSTPVSVNGAVSIGALAICGWQRLRPWSAWLVAPVALAVGVTAPHGEDWVPLFVAAFVWRGAVSTARLDEDLEGTGVTPVLFAISAIGAVLLLARHRADRSRWPSSPSSQLGARSCSHASPSAALGRWR